MFFREIFSSLKVILSIALVLLVSGAITFLPLIGTLGYEYSLAISFILAFVSVFISAKFAGIEFGPKFGRQKGFGDLVSSIFITNYLIAFCPLVIGLASSTLKQDCFIKKGLYFYLLIPLITVFFSTGLGILCGTLFRRWGFLVAALILISTICFSIWRVYNDPSFFFYNTVIGYFPGPLYDEVIPITTTFVVYRIMTLCWGILFLIFARLISGFKHGSGGFWDVVTFISIVGVLVVAYLNENEIGISYTREYITQNYLKSSYETEHFVIYYPPGTKVAQNIRLIADDHEWRFKQLKNLFKINPGEKIRSYIYPDTETRKKLIGAGETTVANPVKNEIHLVYDTFPDPVLKHELAHVMASGFGMSILHVSPKVGLIEGLAVASDWTRDGYTPHQWSKAMIDLGDAPDISTIVGLGFWYAPPRNSYTLMGSFSRFLIDNYGIDKFKALYKTGDFSIYGKRLDELSREWKSFLAGITIPSKLNILAKYMFQEPSIFQGTCPRRIAELKQMGFKEFDDGNFYGSKNLFLEASELNPEDPGVIESLAYSYYFDKDYDELGKLLENEFPFSEVDRAILENLRGNLLWQTGKVEEAESVFRNVVTLPLTDDLQRELDIKLSAMSAGGMIEGSIREFFSTTDDLIHVSSLEELIRHYPYYSPAYYLLGRIFYKNWEFEKAASYLRQSESLGLPSIELNTENLKLLGINLFATGDYDGAIASFQKIILLDPGGEKSAYAKDFIERSIWAKQR
jgi:tetratricopeptide (TPR) repeat protein